MKSTAFDMAMMAYRQNDMEGAFRHFLPLAETGDADAMNMAANMFERGQGTYRDPGRAVFWWKKAVELGNVDALADYGHYLVTTFFRWQGAEAWCRVSGYCDGAWQQQGRREPCGVCP